MRCRPRPVARPLGSVRWQGTGVALGPSTPVPNKKPAVTRASIDTGSGCYWADTDFSGIATESGFAFDFKAVFVVVLALLLTAAGATTVGDA